MHTISRIVVNGNKSFKFWQLAWISFQIFEQHENRKFNILYIKNKMLTGTNTVSSYS